MIFVDGVDVGDIEDVALRDRRMLSADGIFIVVATVSEQDGRSVADARDHLPRRAVRRRGGRLRRGAARRGRGVARALGRGGDPRDRPAPGPPARRPGRVRLRAPASAGRWCCRWSSRSRASPLEHARARDAARSPAPSRRRASAESAARASRVAGVPTQATLSPVAACAPVPAAAAIERRAARPATSRSASSVVLPVERRPSSRLGRAARSRALGAARSASQRRRRQRSGPCVDERRPESAPSACAGRRDAAIVADAAAGRGARCPPAGALGTLARRRPR